MRGKIAIPFIAVSEYDVPIIEFHIGNGDYYAIVDTGAESTIFDSSLKKSLNVNKNIEISIVGVSGESEPQKIVSATSKVWMKNDSGHIFITDVTGYISDISHLSEHFIPDNEKKISAIFGSDMLNNLNAKIDFTKRIVNFSL